MSDRLNDPRGAEREIAIAWIRQNSFVSRVRAWEAAAARRNARACDHFRQRAADTGDGRQGIRANLQCRDAARHCHGRLCDARCALGLRFSRSAAWRHSTPIKAAWCRRAASASIFPAACACSGPGLQESRSGTQKTGAGRCIVPCDSGRRRAAMARCGCLLPKWTGCYRWGAVGGGARLRHADDLNATEESGCMAGADPELVSEAAKRRQRDEMGTLGSGQSLPGSAARERRSRCRTLPQALACRSAISSSASIAARAGWGIRSARNFCAKWRWLRSSTDISLPDRELACAPIHSGLGPSLSGRDARGDQLRIGQSPDSDADDARRLCAVASRRHAFRCCTTFRIIPAKWKSTRSMASSKSCSFIARAPRAAFGPGHPSIPAAAAPLRPAGADRRQHGDRFLCAGRHGARDVALVRIGLPWRRPQHEPA